MNQLDVNEARKRLMDALGEYSKSYFAHLKSWFCMKTDREEFDRQVRHLLPPEKVSLHNEFLFAIVTKCQTLCEPSSVYRTVPKQRPVMAIKTEPLNDGGQTLASNHNNILKRRISAVEIKPVTVERTVKPKNKPVKANFDNRFQPVDPISLLPIIAPSFDNKAHHVRFCSRDNTLPDNGLIHGRMLVAAWDAGLERGCEDKAITLVLKATEQFLKQLIVAIVTNRKGYRLREGKVVHSVGRPTLNPWLRNTWTIHDSTSNSYSTEITTSNRPSHVPAAPVSAQKAERDSAFYLACTTQQDTALRPISVLDLFQTLQVKKSEIPSQTVYAVNMERISQRLYHPD